MTDEADIQFLSPEDLEALPEAQSPWQSGVSLEVRATAGGKIGPFLDIIERLAQAMELEMTMTAPGYTRTFYGYEQDIWSGQTSE